MVTSNRYRFPLLLLLGTLALSVALNGYLLVEPPTTDYRSLTPVRSVAELTTDTSVHAELARVRQQLVECRGIQTPTPDSSISTTLPAQQP